MACAPAGPALSQGLQALPARRHPWLDPLLLALLGLALRLPPWLTVYPLHRDEALYGTWARLIASGRDPLLLTAWIDKPPLAIYLMAVCLRVFGVSETGAAHPGHARRPVDHSAVVRARTAGLRGAASRTAVGPARRPACCGVTLCHPLCPHSLHRPLARALDGGRGRGRPGRTPLLGRPQRGPGGGQQAARRPGCAPGVGAPLSRRAGTGVGRGTNGRYKARRGRCAACCTGYAIGPAPRSVSHWSLRRSPIGTVCAGPSARASGIAA